jgi:hypothetical protein
MLGKTGISFLKFKISKLKTCIDDHIKEKTYEDN